MDTDMIYAEQLAAEYAPKDTSKIRALRKLDQRAKLPATIFVYGFGIVSALVLGAGMCLSMNVIGDGSPFTFGLGIVVGIVGIIMLSVSYPIYKHMLASGRRKYAADVVRLANEITATHEEGRAARR